MIFLVQLKYFKEQFKLGEILKLGIKCIISGAVMFVIVKLLTDMLPISIINTIIEVIVGGIIYIIMLIILKYSFLTDIYNQLIGGIKNKLSKEK